MAEAAKRLEIKSIKINFLDETHSEGRRSIKPCQFGRVFYFGIFR